jgi:hypothetical protein
VTANEGQKRREAMTPEAAKGENATTPNTASDEHRDLTSVELAAIDGGKKTSGSTQSSYFQVSMGVVFVSGVS